MTKKDLRAYLQSKGSPMARYTDDILKASRKWRIDPKLIVAIAGAESSFGKHLSGTFNAWGIGPGRSYGSWTDGINAAAKLLRENYVGEGLTSLREIQAKWAPLGAGNDPTNLNSAWLRNTSTFYNELGGNPNTVSSGFQAGTSPTVKDNQPDDESVLDDLSDYPEFYVPGEGATEEEGYLPTMMDLATGDASATEVFNAEAQRTSAELEEALAPEPEAAPTEAAPSEEAEPATTGGAAPTTIMRNGRPLTMPLGTKLPGGSEFASADPEGAPSRNGGTYHAAKDWFAPGGSAVFSPEGGKIVEVRPSRGSSGQVFGGTVKVQTSDGRVWVFRHVNPLRLREGQTVKAGQRLASVTRWSDNPGSSHSHIELWKTYSGGYNYENMIDPMTWFRP